jgi:hypothetical protein
MADVCGADGGGGGSAKHRNGAYTYCVIDFNYYRGADNELVVKELAIELNTDAVGGHRQHWVFQQPYPKSNLSLEKRAEYLSKKKQVLYSWGEGDVPYYLLSSILCKTSIQGRMIKNTIPVYVYGKEEAQFIANHINHPVHDISELYTWILFGEKVNSPFSTQIHEFALPCMRHHVTLSESCAKARYVRLGSVVETYRNRSNGNVGISIVSPAEPELMQEQCTNGDTDTAATGDYIPDSTTSGTETMITVKRNLMKIFETTNNYF